MDNKIEFTRQASLVLIGQHFLEKGIWSVIEQQVNIKQKVRRHTPHEKLLDTFIAILSGSHGLVEVNTRVRPDRAVQLAFGRKCCAEQSTISNTFDAFQVENVQQMRHALKLILQTQ